MSLLTLQPIVRYPRRARADGSYLLTIDLTHTTAPDAWPYAREEYALTCVLDTGPWFRCTPLGDATMILHRFGGSYGAARFRLQALGVEGLARLRLTFVSEGGMPVKTLDLDNIRVAHDLAFTPETTLAHTTDHTKNEPAAPDAGADPPPRPRLTYTREVDGAQVQEVLPFRLLVIGDFSGQTKGSLHEQRTQPLPKGGLSRLLSSTQPRLELQVHQHIFQAMERVRVPIMLQDMEGFDPPKLAEAIPVMEHARVIRSALQELAGHLQNNLTGEFKRVSYRRILQAFQPAPSKVVGSLLQSPGIRPLSEAISAVLTLPDAFHIWGPLPQKGTPNPKLLLDILKPGGYEPPKDPLVFSGDSFPARGERLCLALGYLCTYLQHQEEKASGLTLDQLLQDMTAELEHRMARQVDEVLGHPSFQALESSWRALSFLEKRLGADGLELETLDVDRDTLMRDIQEGEASGFYHHLYRRPHEVRHIQPFAAVVCLHAFSHEDAPPLRRIAMICEAAKTNFFTAASQRIFGIEDGETLTHLPEFQKLFHSAEYDAWHDLRRQRASRYMSLCFPRILLRPPYGPSDADQPTDAFVGQPAGLWGSGGLAVGAYLMDLIGRVGWPLTVDRSQAIVSDVGLEGSRDQTVLNQTLGHQRTQVVDVEIPGVGDQLIEAGLTPLFGDTSRVWIPSFNTMTQPNQSRDIDDRLFTSLNHVVTINHLCHYLVAVFKEVWPSVSHPEELERRLTHQMETLVSPESNPDDAARAARPLKAVSLAVSLEDERCYTVHLGATLHGTPGSPEIHLVESLRLPRMVDQSS